MNALTTGASADSLPTDKAGKRPALPRIESAMVNGRALQLATTTADHDLLMQAFGTCSEEFTSYAVGQLVNMLSASPDESDVTISLRLAIAAIAGIGPQNEAEAMLAVQMVSAHHASVEMTRKAMRAQTLEGRTAHGNLATKFSRTYLAQLEGLSKIRRGGEQVVKHVHVNEGGQAIVAGTIHQSSGGRG